MHGTDYLTIKYDRLTGQVLWIARYGNPGVDLARSIRVDGRGDVIVTGFSAGSGTGNDYATVKYNGQTGQRLWVARYNGPANSGDGATALALDDAGNIYVTGSSSGLGTGQDYATIKYDGQSGQPIWVARHSSSGVTDDTPWGITIDSTGNVYVTGTTATIKYDGQTGRQIWINTSIVGRAVALNHQGALFVIGGSDYYRTYKINSANGTLHWAAATAENGGGALAIAVSSTGDVCVTGGRSAYDAHALVVKYDGRTGQVIWSQSLRGWCESLAVDQDDNVYVAGSSFSYFPAPIGDFRTVKFDGQTGRLVWQSSYPNAQPHALVVDSIGNVYVTGHEGPDTQERYLTIKYEQSPPGDVNFDFCVDDGDLLRVLLEFGQSGERPEDVNRDGVVDDKDLLTVLFQFGRGC